MPSSQSIPAADILRLIQAHLLEAGLTASCEALRRESGAGLAGLSQTQSLQTWAQQGRWADVLRQLSLLDTTRAVPIDVAAQVHEMSILEVAHQGDLEVAYSLLRLVPTSLLETRVSDQSDLTRGRWLEQILAALAAQPDELPPDYWGRNGVTQQQRRDDIGELLVDTIPLQPPQRLVSLLQQSLHWQAHTGLIPKKRKRVDLVLGTIKNVEVTVVGAHETKERLSDAPPIDTVKEPYSVVKLGKAKAEAAVFAPDGAHLLTGSSDGLIEVWQGPDFTTHSTLSYQKEDQFMGHDVAISAMALSNDGTMLATGDTGGELRVWSFADGLLLQTLSDAHTKRVTHIDWDPSGTHLLSSSHDCSVREFGLRSGRRLKEYPGSSFVHTCCYVDDGDDTHVVSGSTDGSVRVYDSSSTQLLYSLRPVSFGRSVSQVGTSIVADAKSHLSQIDDGNSPSVHSVFALHTPADAFLVVPRGPIAFLVSTRGQVLRTFALEESSKSERTIVAASVSPSNELLYTAQDNGTCTAFEIASGRLVREIPSFGKESTHGKDGDVPELTSLIHHPIKSMLAAFSNSISQKKGRVVLWK